MREYRIIIKTEKSGKKWYYVQYRWLIFFWLYCRESTGGLYFEIYKAMFKSLEDANDFIKKLRDEDYKKSQSKIIKKEIYK